MMNDVTSELEIVNPGYPQNQLNSSGLLVSIVVELPEQKKACKRAGVDMVSEVTGALVGPCDGTGSGEPTHNRVEPGTVTRFWYA